MQRLRTNYLSIIYPDRLAALCDDETGDVAQWLMSRNSNLKTMGSIPLWGRVGDSYSVPPSQLLYRLVLFVPDLPFVLYTTCTRFVCTLKLPYPSVIKRRPHSRWYGNAKTLHTGGNTKLGGAVLAACFPCRKQPKFSVRCIWTRKLSNPIQLSY